MYSHFIAKRILPFCRLTVTNFSNNTEAVVLHIPHAIASNREAFDSLKSDLAAIYAVEQIETETDICLSVANAENTHQKSLTSLVQYLAAHYDLSVSDIVALCPEDTRENIQLQCTGEAIKDCLRIEDTPDTDKLEITIGHCAQSDAFLSWLGRLYQLEVIDQNDQETRVNLLKRRDTQIRVSESEALVDLTRNIQQAWDLDRGDVLNVIHPESARRHTEQVLALRPAPSLARDLQHSYSQDIAIVGSGFSGVATALKILEDVIQNPEEGPIHISLLEREASRFAGGLAYGASDTEHHVNVPSAFLSFDAEDNQDFVNFLRDHTEYEGNKNFLKLGQGLVVPTESVEEAAVQRRLYQYYLVHRLYEKVQHARLSGVADVQIIFDDVADFQKTENGYSLNLKSGRDVAANKVVYATGHGAVSAPRFLREAAEKDSAHIVLDQWNEADKLTALFQDPTVKEIVVLGTGLSAMDVVMSAQKNGVFDDPTRTLRLVSRSGNLHPTLAADAAEQYKQPDLALEDFGALPTHMDEVENYVINAFDFARQKGEQTIGRPHTDEEIFFALSPLIPDFIQSCPHLDIAEMSKLLKKYSSLINTTAVPMAGVIGVAFHDLQEAGKVIVETGDTDHIAMENDNITFHFRDRAPITCNAVVSTLPPASDPSTTPLYTKMIEDGLFKIEPRTGIGLDVHTPTMQAVDSQGAIHKDIFIIGPVVGGDTMADYGYIGPKYQIISGLRDQAKRIADMLQEQRQSQRKPTVGLLMNSTPDLREIEICVRWKHALENYGMQVVLIPPGLEEDAVSDVLDYVDGVMLTGANSNNQPELYDYGTQKLHPEPVIDPARDRTSHDLIYGCIERSIPILGVCRGMQDMNVAMFGELTQSIQGHDQGYVDPSTRHMAAHAITIQDGGVLSRIYGAASSINVTSVHRQGVLTHQIGEGLKIEALSNEGDGVVEALSLPGHPFFVGVQFHPEFKSMEPQYRKLFGAFADSVFRYHKTSDQSPAGNPLADSEAARVLAC